MSTYLYAASLIGQTIEKLSYVPAVLFATNDAEALGQAIILARGRFPGEEGYYTHNAMIMRVPEHIIRDAYHDQCEEPA